MPSDLRAQLESSLGHSYVIERELRAGGMSRVFVATERALGRRVVIKIVSSRVAAEFSGKRFAREIRLAASLQQANIVPVLAAGEIDGLPHYTMPYVEGRSLRERLDEGGPLALKEIVSILRDVARALAYAHEHGVVHRDIKPENVLLSGEAAVVTDFGIAKAVDSARRAPNVSGHTDSTVTRAGMAVGTPAYMAPEQISGDPTIDHRADLYSFGCLAYELVAGRRPFEGGSVHAFFAAHLATQAMPVSERNPATPRALAAAIMRCLEKDPALRPQSAREVLDVLESVAAPASGFTKLSQRLTPRQRIAAVVAGLLLVAGVAATVRARLAARAVVPAIAVVPFFNVDRDTAEEYLADGITEEVSTALGKVPGVRVISRSASRRFGGRRDVDARQVGSALSATHVLQGTVRRVAGRLQLTAHLTNVRDNDEVWSEAYDRAAGDALAVQIEISRAIAAALRGRVGATSIAQVASVPPPNAEAYDLYLRGRYLLQRRGRGVRQATERFARAITLDSTFARAYAERALALELLVYFEPVATDSIAGIAVPAARRALALDSTLATAHTALALAYCHVYSWREAEREYLRALALEPNDPEAHIQYGRFLHYTGRIREALPEFERARRLDPYSAVASGWYGHLLDLRGRPDEAIRELRRALEIDSTSPPTLVMISGAYLHAGNRAAAREYALALTRGVPLPLWNAETAALLAQMGDTGRARSLLRELDAQHPPQPQSLTIRLSLYAGLRDTAHLFESMERATRAREPWPTWYALNERHFDFARSSPRFAAIVRGVGLDDRIFTSSTGGRLP
jgi:TolB-like protein/Flp pilus assembly protein TadD/predicted Ser/Thr protein kinase